LIVGRFERSVAHAFDERLFDRARRRRWLLRGKSRRGGQRHGDRERPHETNG
jgi:hypothetical protein